MRPGQTICDPFAGVGLGALDAMTYGLSWIGCELENRFVALAQQNLALWHRRYGFTGGTVVQGDSRVLRQVLAGVQVECCVGSPPFAGTLGNNSGNAAFYDHPSQQKCHRYPGTVTSGVDTYGTTPGQLGALPPGTPPAVVSSPPYAGAGQVLGTHNGIDWSKITDGGKEPTPARVASGEGYGVTPGQLGNMAVVSSPPYAGVGMQEASPTIDTPPRPGDVRQYRRKAPIREYGTSAGQLGAMPAGAIVSSPPYADSWHAGNGIDQTKLTGNPAGTHSQAKAEGYGVSVGQMGHGAPDTFWSAADAVMREVAALLPVGGIAAWVVKGYVSKGCLVDFPAQWLALCEAHGFRLLEEIHASLIEESGVQETLFGEAEKVQTERKSFFRRLHERKPGAVRIDHETVLILRKEDTLSRVDDGAYPGQRPSIAKPNTAHPSAAKLNEAELNAAERSVA